MTDSTVFVGEFDAVRALDRSTGDARWEITPWVGRQVYRMTAVGDHVFVTDIDGTVYGVADGEVSWRATPFGEETSVIRWSSPVVVDGTVYAGAAQGGESTLFALE